MTEKSTAFDALANASAAMLEDQHVSDILVQLMGDCLEPLSAAAAAILVVEDGDLALLSASTHRAAEIEMLQTQQQHGPCVEAIEERAHVSASGAALVERWGDVGAAIRDAGYDAVDAFPMTWHGQVLGGFNVFRAHARDDQEEAVAMGQAFADIATLVLLHVTNVPIDQVAARVHEAIAARAAVEQAKGVLAYVEQVDMETAFDLLTRRSHENGGSLTATALEVVREQYE
jgi:hypothetical protein